MIVEVSEQDIKNGIACNGWECPVAAAIRRATNESRVFVNRAFIEIGFTKLKTPEAVKEFVTTFDNLIPVAPFSFEITLKW